jgi:hypothetical protein
MHTVSSSDVLVVAATLVSAFGGAWLGHWLAHRSELKRERRRDQSLAGSLLTEVEHNGELAGIYVDQNIVAPAYRMRREVFDSAFPVLVGGRLKADAVRTLIAFYSQVDQVNWELNEVDRLHKASAERGVSAEQSQLLEAERRRLLAKATEMRSPGSRFYSPAVAALKAYI